MPLNKQLEGLNSLTFHVTHFFSMGLEILLELPKADLKRPPSWKLGPMIYS